MQFKKVVIVGGGFGGIQVAKELANQEVEVLLIDKHNYHTFQPLLYQVATGGLEPDSIAFPLRKIFKKQQNFSFRLAEVLEIIPHKKQLNTNIGIIDYDILVLATGSTTNFYHNKDMERLSMPMKSIPEALNLRSLILQHFEEALLQETEEQRQAYLNFIVVGGGPTGVETAGALAELKHHVLPNDYPELNLKKMEVFLVEANPRILKSMSENASYKASLFLKDMGVKVIINTRVLVYDGQQIRLSNDRIIPSKNVIWTAGIRE
jgi:NADH:ubiquinone reductase (H+-translocating)